MMLGHDAVAAVDIAAHKPQAGVAVSVHRDHRARDNPVGIAFLYWSQACPREGGGRGGAARWWGISPPWCPGSPERVVRRPPGRSVRSNPRQSSPPSLSGWRRTGLLVLRRDDYHPPSRRKQIVLRVTIRSRIVPPFIEAQIPE